MSEIGLIEPFHKQDVWTIHCDRCGHTEEFRVSQASETTLIDLAECTYLHYWIEELAFLQELELLVARHPNSNHPYKRMVCGAFFRNILDLTVFNSLDAPFENELLALLTKFGRQRNSFFSLKGRIQTAHASIREQTEQVEQSYVACKVCEAGRMYINPAEF